MCYCGNTGWNEHQNGHLYALELKNTPLTSVLYVGLVI